MLIETRHRTARDLAEQLTRVLSRPAGTATAVGDRMVLFGDLTHHAR